MFDRNIRIGFALIVLCGIITFGYYHLIFSNELETQSSEWLYEAGWAMHIILRIIILLIALVLIYLGKRHSTLKFFLCLFIVFEIVFTPLPISMGFFSYQGFNWMQYNWHPRNEAGYRDGSLEIWKNNQVIKILILGDSFTAGNGIENIEHRYDKVLERILNNTSQGEEQYSVRIAADQGWGLKREVMAFKEFPIKPNVVIYQALDNDLEEIAELEQNSDWVRLKEEISHYPVLGKAYFSISFVCGALPFLWINPDLAKTYHGLMSENSLMTLYTLELHKLKTYCDSNHSRLIVFDVSLFTQESEIFSKRLREYCDKNKIEYNDILDIIRLYPMKDLRVNILDSHPNEKAHNLFGEFLAKGVTQTK